MLDQIPARIQRLLRQYLATLHDYNAGLVDNQKDGKVWLDRRRSSSSTLRVSAIR